MNAMSLVREIRTRTGVEEVGLTPKKAVVYFCRECMGWDDTDGEIVEGREQPTARHNASSIPSDRAKAVRPSGRSAMSVSTVAGKIPTPSKLVVTRNVRFTPIGSAPIPNVRVWGVE